MKKSPSDASINHWLKLAEEEDHKAVIDGQAGHNTSANHHRAALYRRTAEAMRLSQRTGVYHCVCCLKPNAH